MEEKRSKSLGIKYITFKDFFLTETGVKITKDEVKENSSDKVRALYEQRLQDTLYDYAYAKSTKHLRRHKNLNGNYPAKERTKEREGSKSQVAKVAEIVKPKKKEPTNYQILVIRVVMACVGIAAVALSTIYTYQFLLPSNGWFIAITLSLAMIIFSVVSFDVVIFFWMPKHRWLSIIFSVLWVIVAGFSMFSTMSVNYDGYSALVSASYEEHREVNTSRVRIDALERRIQAQQSEVDLINSTIREYTASVETVSAWYLRELQGNLSLAMTTLQELLKQLDNLLEGSPEAVMSEETRDVTFYDSIERITSLSASALHFIVHMLPAVFIDIIAPFSIAIAIFLGGNNAKRKETKA